MSREIDLTDPDNLHPDDIDYLKQRDRWPLRGQDLAIAEAAGYVRSEGGTDDGGQDSVKEYSEMTAAELRTHCEARGLDSSGTKAEMVERLTAADLET
jgi:SAP domain